MAPQDAAAKNMNDFYEYIKEMYELSRAVFYKLRFKNIIFLNTQILNLSQFLNLLYGVFEHRPREQEEVNEISEEELTDDQNTLSEPESEDDIRVQNPWSGGAGFERSGPLQLRSAPPIFHTPLHRSAPLQVIFWTKSGFLLQNR